MRRDLNKPEIPWGIRVSAADNEALSSLLPMNGGKTWLIETGLKAFLDLMEGSPTHREWAHAQIHQANASADRPRRTKVLTFCVPSHLYVRFNKLFPQVGAGSWFVRTLVRATIEDLAASGPTIEDRVGMIVNSAMSPREATLGEVEMQEEAKHFGSDQ